jgi:hypothetical protein
MIKDKELKMELLKKLMKDMDSRVVEKELKPSTKMVVKAEGDSPEEVKEEVLDKLSKMDLPSEEDMSEMAEMDERELPSDMEGMETEEDPFIPEEEDDEYMEDLPEYMKRKLKK